MLPDNSINENNANLSERLLDKEENEMNKETLEDNARQQTEKLTKANDEENRRSDNQDQAERLLDKEEEGEGMNIEQG